MKYIDIENVQEKKVLKLRKGRVALIIAFVVFLIFDLFLVIEYKVKGNEAFGMKVIEKVSDIIDSGANIVSSIWEPKLKSDNNLTSVLIVGIDSRHVEFNGTEFINTTPGYKGGERNTDTIMQVVYDHKNGRAFIISIPRDIGVDIEKECLTFHGSIHKVYDQAQLKKCPEGGVKILIEAVESITGIPVHYYGFVTLEMFISIINIVGEVNEKGQSGIWIDIPTSVYDIYPIIGGGYERVYFPAGYRFLTSEEVLKYARVRQSSSDFARVRRQQQVVEAVRKRVISSETLLNPQKVFAIIKTFKNNTLITMPDLEEIRAGLSIIRDLDSSEIINIVLDPEFGGQHEILLNKQPHNRLTARYYMVPTNWKECPGDEYCKVKDFIQRIIEYPDVYKENPKVFAYSTKYDKNKKPDFSNPSYSNFVNDLPIFISESKYTVNIEIEDEIVIYDFTNGEKESTINALAKKLKAQVVSGNEFKNIRLNKEDIAIVVGSG